jgi:hypothetical protein
MVVKEKVERYLRSAEGRSFPRVATDVLLDIKGYFLRTLIYYRKSVLAFSDRPAWRWNMYIQMNLF